MSVYYINTFSLKRKSPRFDNNNNNAEYLVLYFYLILNHKMSTLCEYVLRINICKTLIFLLLSSAHIINVVYTPQPVFV